MLANLVIASKVLIEHDYLDLLNQLTNVKKILANKMLFKLFPRIIASINDCIVRCECKYCTSHYGCYIPNVNNRFGNDEGLFWGPRLLPNNFNSGSIEISHCKLFKYIVDSCTDAKIPVPDIKELNDRAPPNAHVSLWYSLHDTDQCCLWKEKMMNMSYSDQCDKLYPMIHKMALQANAILLSHREYIDDTFDIPPNFSEWFKVDGVSLLIK